MSDASENPLMKWVVTLMDYGNDKLGRNDTSVASGLVLLCQDITGNLDPVFEILLGENMANVIFNGADT